MARSIASAARLLMFPMRSSRRCRRVCWSLDLCTQAASLDAAQRSSKSGAPGLKTRPTNLYLPYPHELAARDAAGVRRRVHIEIEPCRVVDDRLHQRRINVDTTDRILHRISRQRQRRGGAQTRVDDYRPVHARTSGMNVRAYEPRSAES